MIPEKQPGQRQAVLPETLEIFHVGDMQPDDIRWARTYAMRVTTDDRALWLDASHPTSPDPTEDMPLMITRTLEGFCVTVPDLADIGWGFEERELFNNFGEDVEWLPVVHIFDYRDRLS